MMKFNRIILCVFLFISINSVNGQSALLNKGESGFGIAFGGVSIEDFTSNAIAIGFSIKGLDLSIAKMNVENESFYSQSISYLFPNHESSKSEFIVSLSHSKQNIKTEVRNDDLITYGITASSFRQFRLDVNTNLIIGNSFGGTFDSGSGILSFGLFATLSARASDGPIVAFTPEVGILLAEKRVPYFGAELALVIGSGY